MVFDGWHLGRCADPLALGAFVSGLCMAALVKPFGEVIVESAPMEMSEQLCRAFTFDMVAEPSVTGTLGEANFGPWLAAYLRKQACFLRSPSPSHPSG